MLRIVLFLLIPSGIFYRALALPTRLSFIPLHCLLFYAVHVVDYLGNFIFYDHFIAVAIALYFVHGERHVVDLLLHHDGID